MNIFELFGTITINNKDANKGIDETTQKAKDASGKLSRIFSGIGKTTVAVGKVAAKGLTVIAAAGAAATGAIVKNFANYEQLVGGIETLFKDSADKVMGYANNAYKTAGMSANEYMSTVTSFAATLVKGLGGDTAAAAEMADMAVTDMSDNANKMGTDLSMIQNAYQGFAKQNYTMLDNLKLGYGGTKEEMARLINDSGVLGDTMKVTASTVDNVSFAKIIEAIHVVQSEMGIAGTTAKEASETISGSFSTWKATWTNLIVGMASEDNVEPLIDTFLDAGQTVLKNIGKIVPKIANNFVTGLKYMGTKARAVMSQTVWPSIQEYAKVKFGIELPSWGEIETFVVDWWTAIRGGLGSTCSWTLQLFGMPEESADAIGGKVETWWKGAVSTVEKACTWTAKFFGFAPWTEEDTQKSVEWWKGVSETLNSIIDFIIHPNMEDAASFASYVKNTWFPNMLKEMGSLVIPIATTIMRPIGDNLFKKAGMTQEQIDFGWNAINETTANPDIEAAEKGGEVLQNMMWDGIKNLFGGGDEDGYATGLDFVPYNEMPARLHYGEAVLTREDASAWRSGRAEDVSALANRLDTALNRLAAIMQQVASNTASGHSVVLDSGALVGQLAPGIDARLGTLTARKERRG